MGCKKAVAEDLLVDIPDTVNAQPAQSQPQPKPKPKRLKKAQPKAIQHAHSFSMQAFEMRKELANKIREVAGEIPRELGSLQSLEILAIEDATLTGVIPSSIFNISSLKELYLWTNKLTGNIPRTIGNCTLLSVLDLATNDLTGNPSISQTLVAHFGKEMGINLITPNTSFFISNFPVKIFVR
ncbi:MDIS1-interacting receptor like kinase 1-like [Camellia sinensis]|uniref:MDIS1-interacting receptor like kinase 1-like n=1 Tax=Camellia sinensis TaxID=4442 RepID=UPI001035B691|nr:MDIS1-interacting receptor like kinase 1-like [Camellia sinensis]